MGSERSTFFERKQGLRNDVEEPKFYINVKILDCDEIMYSESSTANINKSFACTEKPVYKKSEGT